jgi:hypothetical protein
VLRRVLHVIVPVATNVEHQPASFSMVQEESNSEKPGDSVGRRPNSTVARAVPPGCAKTFYTYRKLKILIPNSDKILKILAVPGGCASLWCGPSGLRESVLRSQRAVGVAAVRDSAVES